MPVAGAGVAITSLGARGLGALATLISRAPGGSRALQVGGRGIGVLRSPGVQRALNIGQGVGFGLAAADIGPFAGDGGGGLVGGPISSIEPGQVFPTGEVVGKAWSTNGQFNNMGMTLDGKKGIALRNDGTVRIFRYQKHIVISRNPRMGDYIRAERRLDRITGSIAKRSKNLRRQPRGRS